jgi:hypothetical protein
VSSKARTEVVLPVGVVALSVDRSDCEVVAGAPLTVTAAVENAGSSPLFLMVAADRGSGRPADVAFTGQLEGADLVLDDPAAGGADIGGPAGAVPLAAGRPIVQELLVNQFLSLERLADAVPAGESRRLTLRLVRSCRLGAAQADALRARGEPVEVEVALTVRGDPAELDRIADELAQAVRLDAQPGSVAREQALTTLLALRTPAATRHLRSLADHPDPGVRARVGA